MASAGYYREEANRCRKLAAGSPDSDAAKRWRQLATEYDDLAEALEASDRLHLQPGMMQPGMMQQPQMQQPMMQPQMQQPMQQQQRPMQQQPMQQQQQKTVEDEKDEN